MLCGLDLDCALIFMVSFFQSQNKNKKQPCPHPGYIKYVTSCNVSSTRGRCSSAGFAFVQLLEIGSQWFLNNGSTYNICLEMHVPFPANGQNHGGDVYFVTDREPLCPGRSEQHCSVLLTDSQRKCRLLSLHEESFGIREAARGCTKEVQKLMTIRKIILM